MSSNVNHGVMPAMSMSVVGEGVKRLDVDGIEVDGSVKTVPWERRFNPYDFNGGLVILILLLFFFRFNLLLYLILNRTTVCIAGEDFAIAAGCTRMSTGYEILSRSQSKNYQL